MSKSEKPTHVFRYPLSVRVVMAIALIICGILITRELLFSNRAMSIEGSYIFYFCLTFLQISTLINALVYMKQKIEVYSNDTFSVFGFISKKTYSISDFDSCEINTVKNKQSTECLLIDKSKKICLHLDTNMGKKGALLEWIESTWENKENFFSSKFDNPTESEKQYIKNTYLLASVYVGFMILLFFGIIGFRKNLGEEFYIILMQIILLLDLTLIIVLLARKLKKNRFYYLDNKKPFLTLSTKIFSGMHLLFWLSAIMIPVIKLQQFLSICFVFSIFPFVLFLKRHSREEKLNIFHGFKHIPYPSYKQNLVLQVAILIFAIPITASGSIIMANYVFDFGSPAKQEYPVILKNKSDNMQCKIATRKIGWLNMSYRFRVKAQCNSITKSDSMVDFAVCPGLFGIEWLCGVYKDSEVVPLKYSF